MTFTVHDFHDLVVLLEQHPEWQAELRRLILTKDILDLPAIVQKISITIQELAEAQKRTEESLNKLTTRVDALTERVDKLSERVDELAEAQKKTSYQLARLENRIGVSTEEEAADTLRYVLEKNGYRIINGPTNLPLNGEIDVIYQVADSAGRIVTALLEAKVRISWRAVEAWAQRMRSSDFRSALHAAGFPAPYLVYAYGMRADPSAHQAAETFGIGLITGRGEEVTPRGLIL
ncbi:MAG: hypothetical protein ACPL4H_00835 [Anaerolineales bacterium]